MTIRLWLAALFIFLTCFAARAGEEVDLELVFLADASGSIDDQEILFQRQGYVDALQSKQILGAIKSGLIGKIAVTYIEWGAADSQVQVTPWMVIEDEASAARFAATLMAPPRQAFGRNAIGSAIAAAHKAIETNDFDGQRRVIDFSGDSANNWGGLPVDTARQAALDDGLIINALAILCRDCNGRPVRYDLENAYAEQIIGGPGSFVVTADGRARFAEAVRKKLILEIADIVKQPGMIVRLIGDEPQRLE
ncbi:MAG: DUF1194 domain-containing protein [Stappiaceae bacterium]